MATLAQYLEFPVGCPDAVDRRRAVRVIPEPDQVFLIVPAGEMAELTIRQNAALQHALSWAQRLARVS